ncbi:MAG: heavy-metal-associated domain-containing protein, partial [Deltaproteobacteria bacterium]|nr:heavy-metal-associated domain-containing protein [Deltaproteobacteria bacterium]
MQKTIYKIPEMDCPSEENLIRMKLEGLEGIHQLQFNLENRRLSVFHSGEQDEITLQLGSLNLGATCGITKAVETLEAEPESAKMLSR